LRRRLGLRAPGRHLRLTTPPAAACLFPAPAADEAVVLGRHDIEEDPFPDRRGPRTSPSPTIGATPKAGAQACGIAGLAAGFLVNSAAMPETSRLSFDPVNIRAAVFDYGGVLIAGGPSDVAAFGLRVGLTEEVWKPLRRRFFGNEGIWAELERGEVPFGDFTAALRAAILEAGGSVTEEQAAAFMGNPDPMGQKSRLRPAMLDAVRRLRRLVPTALVTNNVREWREGWHAVLEPATLFDVVVDSSEVGARKPEPRIYEITREKLGVAHDEIFFLDDIGQNLKAARALGWNTVLYDDDAAVLATLESMIEALAESGASR
jgi:putative hydrolase of the HAD superfamily